MPLGALAGSQTIALSSRGKGTVVYRPGRGATSAGAPPASEMMWQRMVTLAALGEAPLPDMAKPVSVEIVE
jgi:hypothetical protein